MTMSINRRSLSQYQGFAGGQDTHPTHTYSKAHTDLQ